jgi:hypothetical protein
MICFHRWTKWSITKDCTLYVRKWVGLDPVKHSVGTRIVQRRACKKCGKVQINQQDVY